MASQGDFKARLGGSGLPDAEQQLAAIEPGRNPYVTGASLPSGSPVFVGRQKALHQILSNLRKPDRPACVSVLGERRAGKSSLLNQLYAALAQDAGLLTVHATAQNWNADSQQHFYAGLHRAVSGALGEPFGTVEDYPGFRDALRDWARSRGLRFLLMVDEFEVMAGNPHFDAVFFTNLRTLANEPEYHFGILTASRRPLFALEKDHRIESSSFSNLFNTTVTLGLLTEAEAEWLADEPIARSLGLHRRADAQALWRRDIMPLTGRHPALIQIGMSAAWNAVDGGYDLDLRQLKADLRKHLETWWQVRSPDEQAMLLRCAAATQPPPAGAVFEDLALRGLLLDDGRLFCPFFGEVIADLRRNRRIWLDRAKQIEKGAKWLAQLLETLLKPVTAIVKLCKPSKDSEDGKAD